jgi:quinol monooxygenase YgiN
MKYRLSVILMMIILTTATELLAQDKKQMIRVARIKIDSAQVESYNTMLKEGIEAAIKLEPGVIALYAVHDKKDATNVTVFEIYASEDAYKAHILTPHFLKYKTGTIHMVKSLELIDVDPIAMGSQKKRK